MPLLDRFRSRPEWQHKDAEVRAAAVRRLGSEQQELLLAIARSDTDTRVRRLALKKLTSPASIRELARTDADASIREDASEILLRLALESEEERLALAAVENLTETRHFQAVARSGRCPQARQEALRRLIDSRSLAPVARSAEDPAIRLAALESMDDMAQVAEIALRSEHKDVAMAATARLGDPVALENVAARARSKAAARQARAALEARAVAAPPSAAEPEARVEDSPDEVEEPAAAEPEVAAEPGPVSEEPPLAENVSSVSAEEATAHAEAGELRRRAEEICLTLEGLARSDSPPAREAVVEARRRWTELLAAGAVDPDLLDRFHRSEKALVERENRRHEEGARERRQNLARLEALCEQALSLARAETVTLKDAQSAMRELKSALENPGPLPGHRERQAILARLRSARGALFPRAQELREADEWTRWSNLSRQEDLCRRVEALLSQDPLEAGRHLRELEAEWKEVRQAPRDQGDALWNRFRAARDEVRSRSEAQLAERAQEAEANLRRKEALCAQAEALADSTDWLKTAETLQRLQEQWKRLGSVPKGAGTALWDRFRAACDRFFERRKQDLARRRRDWAQNLKAKETLCEKAEALAASSDWERATAEIGRLQAEWKQIGPVRRNRSDAVWQRFRGACAAFFERYRQRDQLDRAARLSRREAIVAGLEELADEAQAASNLVEAVRAALVEWNQLGTPAEDASLEARLVEARDRVIEAHPEAFRGTELDPAANRAKAEKLCARVEALLLPDIEQDAASLVDRLREALALNTMGGRADAEARWRASAADVEAAQQAWKRLGPVPGEAGRALKERFEGACRRFFGQRPARGRS